MEQRKYFGTDGIRGTANQDVMTADTALKLGMAAGTLFTRGDHRHRVIIGKDTRLSGYLFENAITSGFLSAGMDVFLVGPMPTPSIAMLVKLRSSAFFFGSHFVIYSILLPQAHLTFNFFQKVTPSYNQNFW